MRPVRNADFKKQYLRQRFIERISKKCSKFYRCRPYLNSYFNESLWGFHHYLKDDKGNRNNLNDVIDCLFYLEYLPNCCHTNCSRYPLKHVTSHQAKVRQKTLNKPKWKEVKRFVNGN